MFPIFRGQKNNGDWIEGSLIKCGNSYYIATTNASCYEPVDNQCGNYCILDGVQPIIPETLSISTSQLDKNKTMIFGSFEVDGKMSSGGDRIKFSGCSPETYNVIFENGTFRYNPIGLCNSEYFYNVEDGEIIGKQISI
jgi:hypothetical protein